MRLLSILFLLPLAAAAQHTDTLTEARALAPRPLHTIAVPHFALDSAALARQSLADLPDALRRLPGITLRDYGGAGGLTTVSANGMGASHTQILTDGLPTGDALHGALDLSRYNLTDVGALTLAVADQPDLLCPVRSLAAATLNLTPASPERSVALSQASWNTWEGIVRYKVPSPFLLWGRAANRAIHPKDSICSEAFPQRGSGEGAFHFIHAPNNYPFPWNGETLRRSHSRCNSLTGSLSSRATFSRGTLSASSRYWFSDRQLPGPVIYFNPDAGTEGTSSQELTAQCRWLAPTVFGRYYLATRYAWQRTHYTDSNPAPITPPDQLYAQHEAYLSGGLSANLLSFLSLAYAADLTLQTLAVSPAELLPAGDPRRFSLQQSASLRLHHRNISLTSRLIHHFFREPLATKPSRQRLTPSIVLACRPWRPLTLRAHYKEYFRPPSFTEAYYHHLGNASLLPEISRQTGLGFTLTSIAKNEPSGNAASSFIGRLEGASGCLEGLLFYSRISQRIVSIPYNLFLFRTINADHATSLGLDLSANCHLTLRRTLLSATATYSFLRASSQGLQLPYTPCHSGTVSFAAEHPWLSLSVSLVATGSRWTTLEHAPSTLLPRYSTFNLALWRRFGPLLAKAEVLNFTNAHYCVIARYPMPGISYRLTCAYYY